MSAKARVVTVAVGLLFAMTWIAAGKTGSNDIAEPEPIDFGTVTIANGDRLHDLLSGPEDELFVTNSRTNLETSMLERLRRQSYGKSARSPLGRDRLASMSDPEFDNYLDDLVAEVIEYRLQNVESAERWLDAYRASWQPQPCPADGALDASRFDDLLAMAIGFASFDDVAGFDLSHVADLSLPDGAVHVSRSSFDLAWSVDLDAPGVHPLFAATAVFEGWEFAAFAQLVVGPGEPVRWVQEDRLFLEAEYGSLWISGADAHVASDFDNSDVIESMAGQMYIEDLIQNERTGCEHWAHADGRNRVRQGASFDGSFPAYVAYDAADNLVAITWDFREFMVPEESHPGVAQPTPTPAASNHSGPPTDAEL